MRRKRGLTRHNHRKVGRQPSNLVARLQSVRGEHKECGAEAVELRCLRMRVVAVGGHETRCKAGYRSGLRGETGDCSYLGRRIMAG
jgi:hypothetical protein